MNRHPVRLVLAATVLSLLPAAPAFAVNKDMVQLQTQVQQLQDAVARLQQSQDRQMGTLTELIRQNVDTINKMSATVADLQRRMQTVTEAQGSKSDQLSGQIQSLNDSIDEIRAHLNTIDKSLSGIQNQQQTMGAAIQNLVPPAPAAATTPDGAAALAPTSTAPAGGSPVPNAPALKDLYQVALGDYMADKPIARDEFNDVISYYPTDDLAGNAYYYLGELDYRKHDYASAVKSYTKVIEGYPNNNKIPAARLHKGYALIALKKRSEGEQELQALLQRFPNAPEAAQARSRLNALGVRIR